MTNSNPPLATPTGDREARDEAWARSDLAYRASIADARNLGIVHARRAAVEVAVSPLLAEVERLRQALRRIRDRDRATDTDRHFADGQPSYSAIRAPVQDSQIIAAAALAGGES
jgi:hypothetical protein